MDSRFFKQQCYINGDWVDGGGAMEVDNPATGEIIGTAPKLGADETIKAIDSAHEAFLDWREKSAAETR